MKPIPPEALAPIPLTIPDGAPFSRWDDGSVRVTGTRIHFWLVARMLLGGEACEEILESLPTLTRAQVEGIAAFVQGNRAEVDEHLRILTEHEDIIERHIKAEQAHRTLILG